MTLAVGSRERIPSASDVPAWLQTLDNDAEPVWVAGGAYVSKIYNSQIIAAPSATSITATLGGTTIWIPLSTSAVHDPFSFKLAANLGSACTDPTDGCCSSGSFDAGIVVASNSAKVYAANSCRTGLVGLAPSISQATYYSI